MTRSQWWLVFADIMCNFGFVLMRGGIEEVWGLRYEYCRGSRCYGCMSYKLCVFIESRNRVKRDGLIYCSVWLRPSIYSTPSGYFLSKTGCSLRARPDSEGLPTTTLSTRALATCQELTSVRDGVIQGEPSVLANFHYRQTCHQCRVTTKSLEGTGSFLMVEWNGASNLEPSQDQVEANRRELRENVVE